MSRGRFLHLILQLSETAIYLHLNVREKMQKLSSSRCWDPCGRTGPSCHGNINYKVPGQYSHSPTSHFLAQQSGELYKSGNKGREYIVHRKIYVRRLSRTLKKNKNIISLSGRFVFCQRNKGYYSICGISHGNSIQRSNNPFYNVKYIRFVEYFYMKSEPSHNRLNNQNTLDVLFQ